MPIKPIDLQTNIGQMHEVARGEQTRSEGVVEQQHVLEKESDEKSRLVQSRLDENKKGERAVIMREEKESKRRGWFRRREKRKKKESEIESSFHDDKIGSIIDIKK